MKPTITLPCKTQLTVHTVGPRVFHLELKKPNGTLEVVCPHCSSFSVNPTSMLNIERDSLKPVIQFLTLLYDREEVER